MNSRKSLTKLGGQAQIASVLEKHLLLTSTNDSISIFMTTKRLLCKRGFEFIIAAIALLSTGCQTFQCYSGPKLPRERVAVLKIDDELCLRRLDNLKTVMGDYDSITLYPGHHSFSFTYYNQGGTWTPNGSYSFTRWGSSIDVDSNFEAGKTYKTDVQLYPGSWNISISQER